MEKTSEPTSMARIRTTCLVIIAVGVVAAGLYVFRTALIPFVIAAFFHFSLAPLVDWQRKRWNMPRWAAVATTTALGLIVFAAAWAAVVASLIQLASSLPAFEDRVMEFIDQVVDFLPLRAVGMTKQEARDALSDMPENGALGILAGGVSVGLSAIGQGVLVLMFMAFMLMSKAVGKGNAPELLAEFENSVQRYMVRKVVLAAVEGLLTWGILAALGVEFALVLGLMTFLLSFIPNIGSIIAAVLPIPVLLLGDYSLVTVILALSLPAVAQFIIGNIVEPKWMGKSLGLHPVVVILGLVVFSVVWGIPGAFLATPMLAVLKTGAAYLPIDPALPDARIDALLLSGRKTAQDRIDAAFVAESLGLEKACENVDIAVRDGVPLRIEAQQDRAEHGVPDAECRGGELRADARINARVIAFIRRQRAFAENGRDELVVGDRLDFRSDDAPRALVNLLVGP